MTWLLLQIGLCLLLAGLAGWFLGWSMRGFRETDQVEDLRQTLSATVDVKDRELSESYRQVESLRSRCDALERTNRGLERRLDERTKPKQAQPPQPTMLAPQAPHPSPEIIPERSRGGAAVEVLEDARQRRDARTDLATERRRRAEVEAELTEKASTLMSLRSEAESLRAAVDGRAAHIAKLESRVLELEPLEERLRHSEAKVAELEATAASELSPAQEVGIAALQEQLNAREVRINELRTRSNDLHAELDTASREHQRANSELAESKAGAVRLRRELDESTRKLRRQIERNQKQEAVHRSVVENLRREIESQPATNAGADKWQEALTERDSQIAEYRRRLTEFEGQRHSALSPSTRDNLQLIWGVGAVFERKLNGIGVTHFAQIAQWTSEDIERVAKALDTNVQRIVRAGWVESARKLS